MHSLRDLAKALAETDAVRSEGKAYDRLRMLRDRGLIPASGGSTAGKTTRLDAAGVVFAVLAFHASEAGTGVNAIGLLKDDFHCPGRPRKQEIRAHLADIQNEKPVFARMDIRRAPWPSFATSIGGAGLPYRDMPEGTVQTIVRPLAHLALPVLAALKELAN